MNIKIYIELHRRMNVKLKLKIKMKIVQPLKVKKIEIVI